MNNEDSVIVESRLLTGDLAFSPAERAVLRRLAGEVAELAARPIEDEKRDLWRRHNQLETTRPLVFCDPENAWAEIIPPATQRCENAFARDWEMRLLKEIFWGTQMRDDRCIEPCFDIPHVHTEPFWGVKEERIGGEAGGAYTWKPPIQAEADLERLHCPEIAIDFAATARLAELAHAIFGDLLSVRVKTQWWWTLGMTWTLINLRGMQQVMLDMADNPAFVHRLMSVLRDGSLAMLDALEARGLLYLNNDGSYVGSGGFGWTAELPQPDFGGQVRTRDMWGFAESQETVGVSPRMYAEFVFPYQLPLLERFGLNYYGCCEPLDKRWPVVARFPRLRRVSVSPWSDRARMAEYLGDRYVYSLKPIPTDLAMDTFDEEAIRAKVRDDLHAARNCRVEVIMKDTNTIRNETRRVIRWVEIARQEAERR